MSDTRMDSKMSRGGTIRTETAPDRSSYKPDGNEAFAGKKMAGGPTDLSRSISDGKVAKV